jgi:hypothetical protein
MLAGPVIGNVVIWLLVLWMKNSAPKPPPARRPSHSFDGPETIPIGSKPPGSALSDFVKAMREEDRQTDESPAIAPGVPTRIQIHSPKAFILTPLFPLSAPLTDETCMSPCSPLGSNLSRQINGSVDLPITKTSQFSTTVTSTANLLGEKNRSSQQPAEKSSSSAWPLTNKTESVPDLQSCVHQTTASAPSEGWGVRFSPHVRVVSTGAELFPANEQNPLSPTIDLPARPIHPAVW